MNEHRVSERVQKEPFGRIVFVFIRFNWNWSFFCFVLFFIDLLQYFTLPCLFVINISMSKAAELN